MRQGRQQADVRQRPSGVGTGGCDRSSLISPKGILITCTCMRNVRYLLSDGGDRLVELYGVIWYLALYKSENPSPWMHSNALVSLYPGAIKDKTALLALFVVLQFMASLLIAFSSLSLFLLLRLCQLFAALMLRAALLRLQVLIHYENTVWDMNGQMPAGCLMESRTPTQAPFTPYSQVILAADSGQTDMASVREARNAMWPFGRDPGLAMDGGDARRWMAMGAPQQVDSRTAQRMSAIARGDLLEVRARLALSG